MKGANKVVTTSKNINQENLDLSEFHNRVTKVNCLPPNILLRIKNKIKYHL